MKQGWSAEELAEHWTLLPSERELLANKTAVTRLGFAVLLKFFQVESRFPRNSQEISGAAVEYLARQIGVPATEWIQYDWESRAAKYHRTQIRSRRGESQAGPCFRNCGPIPAGPDSVADGPKRSQTSRLLLFRRMAMR